MSNKKVNFFLPFYKGIAGGYKVVYEYANFLIKNGYDVAIYYDINDGENKKHLPKILMRIYRRLFLLNYPYYFKLDKKVKQYGLRKYDKKYIRTSDYNIATAPTTAYGIHKLNNDSKQLYFIQGYENWGNSEEYLIETYKYNMKKIVVSDWLKDIVKKYSNDEIILIRNGLDLNKFKPLIDLKNRDKFKIAMIYRVGENKACKYGLDAICELKKKYKKLELNVCGDALPKEYLNKAWIHFKKDATENDVIEMLNNSSIYVCTSIFEGFGLPGLEAMACGCALVTTNCKGPREYANENNAIICKSKSKKEIYLSIEKYLINDDLRKNHIQNALKTVEKWNIEESKEKFAQLLQ